MCNTHTQRKSAERFNRKNTHLTLPNPHFQSLFRRKTICLGATSLIFFGTPVSEMRYTLAPGVGQMVHFLLLCWEDPAISPSFYWTHLAVEHFVLSSLKYIFEISTLYLTPWKYTFMAFHDYSNETQRDAAGFLEQSSFCRRYENVLARFIVMARVPWSASFARSRCLSLLFLSFETRSQRITSADNRDRGPALLHLRSWKLRFLCLFLTVRLHKATVGHLRGARFLPHLGRRTVNNACPGRWV